MRKRIFEIIEIAESEDRISHIYDVTMFLSIIISIIPLAFKNTTPEFVVIDQVTACIFIVDYALRLLTADYKLNDKALSFVKYPFTPMAIIDLLSISPSFTYLNSDKPDILEQIGDSRTSLDENTFAMLHLDSLKDNKESAQNMYLKMNEDIVALANNFANNQ